MTAPSDTEITLHLATEADTVQLGRNIASCLPRGAVVWLEGQLGAGKTTLSRGVLEGLGHCGAVKSPTYTIVEPYEGLVSGALYHFDLYRLGDPEELEYLGMRDYVASGGRLLIEWPERGGRWVPRADMMVTLQLSDTGREARISVQSEASRGMLMGLRQ